MKNSPIRIGITAPVKAGQNLPDPLRNGAGRKLIRNSYPLITLDNDLYIVCANALSQSPAAFVITSDRAFIHISD